MPILTLQSPPAGMPTQVEIVGEPKTGGEGAVYFSRDGQYAVKLYHQPRPDKEQLLQYVMKLFQSLPPEQEKFILPPRALVASVDGQRRVGFIMRRVPPRYREMLDFMFSPVAAVQHFQKGKTWAHFLKIARSVANAIVVLHGKGCAHSDIHFRNFLANLDDGEAIMLEIDGVVVAGFLPPQVKGMMGFMAPEILTQHASPSERTDRHSLAVLLLHTLLLRNVMQPQHEYDNDQIRSEELGWGQFALFSEHPEDHWHRPHSVGQPLYKRGALSYKMLSPALQKLTERAMIDGLKAPDKRPSAREWEEALAGTTDEIWMCGRCRQHFPYPYWVTPAPRRQCPFCGERVAAPYPVVLELFEERSRHNYAQIGRRVVLGHGFKLFADVIEPGRKVPCTRRNENRPGHVEWDRKAGKYRLVNDEGGRWSARLPNATERSTAGKGQSILLQKKLMIHCGDGRRLMAVVEDGS